MAYYGEDHSSDAGSDSHKLQLIKDTFDAIAEPVNLNDYSEIMIIHAGIGQEDSPRLSYLIWSDAYYEEISISTRQGAIIHSVAIAPEMESGNHSALGVYAHEYGHLLSLPDLYDSSLESGVPDDFVGRWSLMGTGLWLGNPNGTSPAELEAWSRIKLAWLVPDTLELAPGNPSFYHESLHPLETSNGIRAIKIPFSQNEYYLIEFRRRINFDRYLPSEGVLITRVDETKNTGVVQVMSANGSSPTLNHAAYGVGGVFNDTEHGIVIDIMARNSITYSILVGNQSPSPSDLTMTSITGPETINATQSQPAIFSAKLTDSSGIPLGALIVRVQCYENDTWNDVGLAVTNGGGIANFNKSLTLKPGKYEMRYLFTGSRIGSRYYVGSDQLAVLNIRKTGTNLTHELFYGAVALIMVASLATGYLIFQIRRRPKNSN
jgi:M6 family metalloprotease-like protein